MQRYFVLFAWEVVIREMPTLLLNEWICPYLAKNFH